MVLMWHTPGDFALSRRLAPAVLEAFLVGDQANCTVQEGNAQEGRNDVKDHDGRAVQGIGVRTGVELDIQEKADNADDQ